MGKGNSNPKAPSYEKESKQAKKITKAAIQGAETQQKRSDEQFAYFKEQGKKDRAVVDKANAGLFDTASKNEDFGGYLQDRYKTVFQPLEDDLIKEFQDYATPGRYDLNRGRAMSDVAQQFDAARKNATRELESFGINPAATRYAALDLGVRTQEAAAKAAAANQADVQTDNIRRALRSQGIDIGLKYPGFADTAFDTAVNANNSAVNNTLNATRTEGQVQGTAPEYAGLGAQYLNTATGANKSGADIQNTGFQNQMDVAKLENEQSSGWGDALGLAAGVGTKAFLGPTMPWAFAAEGGAIPSPNAAVPDAASPSGGQQVDDVNAKLTAGEFVLPEDVTRWIGEKKLQDMILKARNEKEGAKAKPTQGQAIPGPTTYVSRPGMGAIPQR